MSKALQVSPELKPCPFCGSPAEFDNKALSKVSCSNRECGLWWVMDCDPETWNKRPTTDAVPKGVVAWQHVLPEGKTFEGNKRFQLLDSEEEAREELARGGTLFPLGVLPFDAGEGFDAWWDKTVDEMDAYNEPLKMKYRECWSAALSGRQAATWKKDSTRFPDGVEYLAKIRGCQTGKIVHAVLKNTEFGPTMDGSELSNAWDIIESAPLPSSPELNRGNG